MKINIEVLFHYLLHHFVNYNFTLSLIMYDKLCTMYENKKKSKEKEE